MIIDVHGHMSAPAELWAYKAVQLAGRGSHGRGKVNVSDDQIRAAYQAKETFGGGHVDLMDKHGTDFQLISPRPFHMMHSEKPGKIVQWFHEECHNIIDRAVKLWPDRFAGVCMLPQQAGQPITVALPELERCVKEMGFVGCLVNSDPYENSGTESSSTCPRCCTASARSRSARRTRPTSSMKRP
jgi:OH-DDVA meta-cleavage compound hydrolase